jgi:hypothetical protein
MTMDERKPGRLDQPGHKMYDGRLSPQCCGGCWAYMSYGPEICSHCLSEDPEWVSPGQEKDAKSLGPR